jgi:hypothetical protein
MKNIDRKGILKHWYILLTFMLVAAALTACGGAQETETSENAASDYESEALATDYEDALDVSGQLALGTLQLEGTEHAVTPEQAEALIPLWQALQGGVTAEAEVSAVLKGIEGAMTKEQLSVVADMKLAQEDVQAWAEEQGVGFGREGESPGIPGTRQPAASDDEIPPDMATRRAQFENMSEGEREAMRATAQAGGGIGVGRGGAGGGAGAGGGVGGIGQARLMLRPLIDLLSERAGAAET